MAAGDHKKDHAGLRVAPLFLKANTKHFKDCPGIRYELKPMAGKCVSGAHLVPLTIGLPGSDLAFEAEVLSDYRQS